MGGGAGAGRAEQQLLPRWERAEARFRKQVRPPRALYGSLYASPYRTVGAWFQRPDDVSRFTEWLLTLSVKKNRHTQ